MNKLTQAKRVQIIAALVEGNSIRATCRMTGAAKGTVLKLVVDLGKACAAYQDRTLRNLTCKKIQCDEIWSFCYAKEKNVPEEMKGTLGFWGCLDMGSHRCGYQADRVLSSWGTHGYLCKEIYR
jgi:hypothetical protein